MAHYVYHTIGLANIGKMEYFRNQQSLLLILQRVLRSGNAGPFILCHMMTVRWRAVAAPLEGALPFPAESRPHHLPLLQEPKVEWQEAIFLVGVQLCVFYHDNRYLKHFYCLATVCCILFSLSLGCFAYYKTPLPGII